MASSAPVKLYYFDFPGRAESSRLAFVIGHVPFEDVRFKKEDAQQYKSKSPTGLLPFAELPDGSVLVESSAIMMYAAKLGDAGLIPEDPVTFGATMMMIQYIEGVLNNMSANLKIEDKDAQKEHMEKFGSSLAAKCEKSYSVYKQFAPKTDGKFLFGDKPTIADIHMSSLMAMLLSGLVPHVNFTKDDIVKVAPKFVSVMENLMEIPEVKEYKSKHTV